MTKTVSPKPCTANAPSGHRATLHAHSQTGKQPARAACGIEALTPHAAREDYITEPGASLTPVCAMRSCRRPWIPPTDTIEDLRGKE